MTVPAGIMHKHVNHLPTTEGCAGIAIRDLGSQDVDTAEGTMWSAISSFSRSRSS